MTRALRLLLIVPHDLSRRGLEMLTKAPGSSITITGSYKQLRDGETALRTTPADVLLLDEDAARREPITAILARLRADFPDMNILVLSSRLDPRYAQSLFQHGALGYIYRNDQLDEQLAHGIGMVAQGYFYISPYALSVLFKEQLQPPVGELTARDLEVLRMIDRGLTPKQIADALGLSLKSAYRIRSRLRLLLTAPSSDHLIAAARAHGLLEDGEPDPDG